MTAEPDVEVRDGNVDARVGLVIVQTEEYRVRIPAAVVIRNVNQPATSLLLQEWAIEIREPAAQSNIA